MSYNAYFFKYYPCVYSIFIYYFGIIIFKFLIYKTWVPFLKIIPVIKISLYNYLKMISNCKDYNIWMYELIQYGILTIICTYLVLRYAAPSVTWHVKFWSILTWVLNFALALLVPEDTYWTLMYPDKSTP